MSPGIWTQCGGSSRLRPFSNRAWRAVEAQHIVATRKLVDSAEEQEILEGMIDRSKPPAPRGPEFAGLHYLLSTPFRYPPLPHGSRFGTRSERSIWYGATGLRGVFAEVAYYRLLFLEGTGAPLDRVEVELSAFDVPVRTRRGIDLTAEPFSAFRSRISSPTDYGATQELGSRMREAGAQAFRYVSARDREAGTNIGVFTQRAFASKRPGTMQNWYCLASRDGVDFSRKDFFSRDSFRFPRADFLVSGRLPSPAF